MEDMNKLKEAPQQYKQSSRKGKKAWRKHVDISDVQLGLEQAQEELIQGGVIAEKSSDSLFTLDTTGSAVIQKSYNKVHKPLKADEILAQRSVVPVIDSHKKPSGTTNGIIEPSSKKRKTNSVSLKEYERLRSVAYGTQSVKDIIKPVDTSDYDPWSLTNPDEASQDPKFSYLEKKKPIRAPPTLREAPVSLTASKGQAPAVPAPKPGTSYNPVFEDWDALLVSEGAKEIEAEKKRLQAAAIETARLERIAAAEQEREREHDGDGVPTEDESAWEGFESDFLGAEWLKKKRPERKTPAERNKIKRRQEAERRRKAEVKEKERERQQKQLGEIIKRTREKAKAKARSVERLEKEREETQQEEVDEKVLRRRRFGKDALPEPPLELVLPDELQDSLRLLKPEGNMLRDRFRNLLVRGKMETRKPIQQPKKKRRTITEKWSYKDFAVPT